MIDSKIGILIAVVFGIVETLEKFGLAKKYAHLIALPLGVIGSFFFLELPSTAEYIIYGLFSGVAGIGTCDTLCNVLGNIKEHTNKK
ncbi:hypothetical protein [Crassaminicella profunda]|uniref:hypothetical protein n=1 Tax=Crassaminicella profunda TaxID=1286698 RepID=UPI001CA697F0|nr:hypothetical protein [Crassaminicella profunda]QZY54368.1 hypothetical protein K7H06_15150 [Crassaminicella profunda]